MAITFINQLLDRLRNDVFPGNHPFGLLIAASVIIATSNHIYHYTLSGLFTGTLFILFGKGFTSTRIVRRNCRPNRYLTNNSVAGLGNDQVDVL